MNRLLARCEFAPHRILPGAVVIALYAAGAAGAPWPAWARIGLAVSVLALWPGAMLLRFLLTERELEWPERIAYSFALGLFAAQLLAAVAAVGSFDPGVGLWLLPVWGDFHRGYELLLSVVDCYDY